MDLCKDLDFGPGFDLCSDPDSDLGCDLGFDLCKILILFYWMKILLVSNLGMKNILVLVFGMNIF